MKPKFDSERFPGRRTTLGLAAWITLCLLVLSAHSARVRAADKPATASTRQTHAPTERPSTNAWQSLFDGESLTGWRVSDFAGTGEVTVKDGRILLGMGVMSGITYTNTNALPRMSYEVELEAMRVEGSDFFCALTFPVGKDPCSLIVGGWGGGVVGLSSLDGQDAANNETTQYLSFKNGQWYRIRLRVAPTNIRAWIDGEKVVDADITDRRVSIRIEVEASLPFGIATWSTAGAVRDIRIRRL
jgi:hypothetical protein